MVRPCFALLLLATGLMAQPYGYQVTTGSTVSVFGPDLTETGAIGFPDTVDYLLLTPDGSRAFLNSNCCFIGTAEADLTTRTLTRSLKGAIEDSIPLVASPNGTIIYGTDSVPGEIAVIDVATGSLTRTISVAGPEAQFGGLKSLQISPDGQTLYAASITFPCSKCPGAPYIVVLDADAGSTKARFAVPNIFDLEVLPDGSRAYYSDGGNVVEIDLASGATIATIPIAGGVVALSRDGRELYIATNDLTVIDTTTNQVRATLTLNAGSISGVVIDDDRHTGYIAYDDNTGDYLSTFDTTNVTLLKTAVLNGIPANLAASADRNIICVGLQGPTAVSVVNAGNSAIAGTVESSYPFWVAASPDATRVYILQGTIDNQSLLVADALAFQPLAKIAIPGVTSLAEVVAAPDGKTIYVAPGINLNNVYVLNSSTYAVIDTLSLFRPSSLKVSPDGRYLYFVSGSDHSSLQKYDVIARRTVATLPVQEGILQLVLSNAGDRLYLSTIVSDHVVGLSTDTLVPFMDASYCAVDLALSPTGNILYVTGCKPQSNSPTPLFLLDSDTGALRNTFMPDATIFNVIQIGRHLYTAAFGSVPLIIDLNLSTYSSNVIPTYSTEPLVFSSKWTGVPAQ